MGALLDIEIKNSNNIDRGNFSIKTGCLNIKYAINGTGKSTIAKTLAACTNGNQDELAKLIPYKFLSNPEGHFPTLSGLEGINSVQIFNDTYVDNFIFQSDEVVKDSFSIFVKTPDYDRHMQRIHDLLSEVNAAFQNHPELDALIENFSQFINGFGRSKSGLSAASPIVRGLGKGNKITNIPPDLEVYAPYLQRTEDASNVRWLKWQTEGTKYLNWSDRCPYCSASVKSTKDTILKVTQVYSASSVEHLNTMLQVFDKLMPYFADETAAKVREIQSNALGLTEAQQNYLTEIKSQVQTLLNLLTDLKHLGFASLKNAQKIADELRSHLIDLSYFSHLNSPESRRKVEIVNSSLNTVIEVANVLQGEVVMQNRLIQKTVQENSKAINEFLQYAGYKYSVTLEETPDQTYKMFLKPHNIDTTIDSARNRLSYGERNAFALVLFMFSALKENPDLVILDDPISSFDGNKKFAIINMLFLSKRCLKNRTVLLLTHEFNTVIDIIRTMIRRFTPMPVAAFLTTHAGILTETPITRSDIRSFHRIARDNIIAPIDNLNRMIYLRRLLEAEGRKNKAWQLISNILHKRNPPLIMDGEQEERPMTQEEIDGADRFIKGYIPSFDYHIEYEKTQNPRVLIDLYDHSTSNYEKLQIYRIIFNENNENLVVRKFVNETFHVENDYLFQLNPREYDTVPQYIIDECDKDILSIRN